MESFELKYLSQTFKWFNGRGVLTKFCNMKACIINVYEKMYFYESYSYGFFYGTLKANRKNSSAHIRREVEPTNFSKYFSLSTTYLYVFINRNVY